MASNHRPRTIRQNYKTQHLALATIITCGGRFHLKIWLLWSIKIHISTMTSCSHIEPQSNISHRLWYIGLAEERINIFVSKSHDNDKVQLMTIKNQKNVVKMQNHSILTKTRQNTTFWQNHSI